MTNELTKGLMSEPEARSCVQAINAGIAIIRRQVLDLHDREGWRALGYTSWRACVVEEFPQTQRHLYRLLEAGQIEREICPTGQTGEIPERHLRELAPLRDDPETMREVWQHVHEEHGENVTAERVREIVEARAARAELHAAEEVIERAKPTLAALAEINRRGFYRYTHASFSEYCRERWGLSTEIIEFVMGIAS